MNKLLAIFFILIFIISCDKNERTLDSVPSNYISVDDLRVHFKEYGQGDKTLIFVHGWGCDLNTWKYQFDYFKDKYHLVFIDLPGHGKSDKPKINYTIDYFAQSVKYVMDDLGIKSPILIGHSMGFPVCQQVIRKLNDNTASICNVDGVYFKFPQDSIENVKYKNELSAFAKMFKGINYEKNARQFISGFITDKTPEYAKEYILSTMTSNPEYVGCSSMNDMIDEKYWKEDVIYNQALAIYAKTFELPVDNKSYLESLFHNLTYHEIRDVNHFLMMEKPIEFNNLLERFIEQK
ncbi:alpha/beta hydrolase [Labilibaculum sp. DW002]|uniref:Alpha/beta hydrolase n=1 Tax=Paralabilibaculum antarcticum TaxID=2912572 RepID=A0ABT5VW01_9BACT|nr:alpha/beta hydrolase [Labilibaculum sp. DW002]MDE5419601.1 alpha/beta hydrolase [Labilibaculum sp. DW002]